MKCLDEIKVELITTPKYALFAGIMFYLEFKLDRGCAYAWTDGKHLAVNPATFTKMIPPKRKSLVIHELAHNFLLHPWRMGKNGMADMQIANEAADYVINLLIKEELGLPIEDDWLYDAQYRGMSMEEVYRRRRDDKMASQKSPESDSKPADDSEGQEEDENQSEEGTNGNEEGMDDECPGTLPDSSGDGAGDSSEDEKPADGGSISEDELQDGDNASGGVGEEPEDGGMGEELSEQQSPGGSGTAELDGEAEQEVEGPASHGEVRQAPGDMEEVAHAEEDMRRHIEQAIERASRTQGCELGSFAATLHKQNEAHLPWKEVLARYVQEACPTDYNWSRPSRRHSGEMAMPSLHEQKVTGITLAIDTSASVSNAEIEQCWSEVQGIISQMTDDYEITILWFDTSVYPQVLVPGDEPIATGRGGTDFNLPFEWIAEEDHDTKLLIFLTDGECYAPQVSPDYEVLWILTRPCNFFEEQKPFGEIIVMD